MRSRCVALLVLLAAVLGGSASAHAGDAAKIVFKSGVVISLTNGYKQLTDGMKELKAKGSQNYPIEILIEGTSFFVNLGEVAVLCRDTCSALTIVAPRPSTSSQTGR
jgi:hypothetical protein